MSSIAELVELLKEGSISKEQMLERIYNQSFPPKPNHDRLFEPAEIPAIYPEKKFFDCDTEIDFYPTESEDFIPRQAPSFEPSFLPYATEEFLERQTQWDFKKNVNQESMKEQKLRLETKECTFHPKTNEKSTVFSQDTIDRLTKIRENTRLVRLKEEQERKKLEEEMEACTFHPQINKNSCISGSKYMKESNRLYYTGSTPTFIPTVKGPTRKMKAANEYIKQDPFERLSRPREAYQPEPEEPEYSMKSSTPLPEYSGCSFSTRPFFERQALYELMKHEKKQQLSQKPPKNPVMNERSKKLVKTDFFERNEEMIRKKLEPSVDYPEACSFQPKITNLAKMRRNRSVAEMAYGDSKKKSEKIEFLKEMAEEKFKESINPSTFQSKSYANVKSKLQILDDPHSYIDRIKYQQRRKEAETQILKDEKARQEVAECTHSPNIIDAPGYVKQIARNMAMIRSEMAVEETTAKPQWR